MLFRAQARIAALDMLRGAITTGGAEFVTSKDTPVQAATPLSIIVYTDDSKEGIGTAPPSFRTTVLTTVEINAQGRSKDAAEALCDEACDLAENALLNGGSAFQKLFSGIDSVETHCDYRGLDNKSHTFTAVIEIRGHALETFEPVITTQLSGATVYVDSVNIFDPNGTYEPPFDYPVADPPRASGPDGRTEIQASIQIPQE